MKFKSSIFGSLIFLAPLYVNAASIGLTTGVLPDLTTSNAAFDFSFQEAQCANITGAQNAPASGDCGTTANLGGSPKDDANFSGTQLEDASGLLSITGTTMTMEAVAGETWFIESGSQGLDYNLTANFDGLGNIVGATVSIFGEVNQIVGHDPGNDFQSGLLASSVDLVDFGFSGDGTTGSFEFVFSPVSGDIPGFDGGSTLEIIASGVNTFSALAGFSNGANGWDPLADNDTTLFTQSFSGTGSVDTFVPVPAGIWLFLSSLTLIGFVKKSRKM